MFESMNHFKVNIASEYAALQYPPVPTHLYTHFKASYLFFFQSRRGHTILQGDWSSDVSSSDLRLTLPRHRQLAQHRVRHGRPVQAVQHAADVVDGVVELAEPIARPDPPAKGEVVERNLRSEEHTSELQSPCNHVCRLLLEKKNTPSLNVRVIEEPCLHHNRQHRALQQKLHEHPLARHQNRPVRTHSNLVLTKPRFSQ